MTTTSHDVIVMGGGPAGATAAIILARAGRSVLVLEKERFPRFHVGESLLPAIMPLFEHLGVLDDLSRLPQMEKRGAAFAMGDAEQLTRIRFAQSLTPATPATFNIERALLDDALLDAARRAGAEVRPSTGVQRIVQLTEGDVCIEAGGQTLRSRYVIDATGQSTVLGRHFRTRRVHDGPLQQKVAYFGHFRGVDRATELEEGDIIVILCDEAWFWLIPIDPVRTSIGMVIDADAARRIPAPPNQRLAWGIERCPAVARRLRRAEYPPANHVTSDFSYTCEPYAGPGYYMVGDAATFLDPIFSTGIYLGMEGARYAAELINDQLDGHIPANAARDRYTSFVSSGAARFERLICGFYRAGFRDLFLKGRGPMKTHRALVSVMSGHVYPRVSWSVRWRLTLFEVLTRVQEWLPIAERRNGFSLMDSTHRMSPRTEAPTRSAALRQGAHEAVT